MNNIIFIVADALRADRLSITGYRRKNRKLTPNLDSLANDGKFYKRSYSPGSWTFISQPALLTGKHASNIGYPGKSHKLEGESTLGEEFSDAGYETRAYNMAPFLRSEMGFSQGFDHYEDVFLKDKFEPEINHLEGMIWNLINGSDQRTRYTLKQIKKWLKKRNDEEPFFLFWNPVNPHNKYDAPRGPWKELERETDPEMNEEKIEKLRDWGSPVEYESGDLEVTEEEMDVVESYYDAEIAYLDYRIGQLISFLKKRELYDETTIVFTSDHGENFGEKNLMHHGRDLNEHLIRVPLIISGPKIKNETLEDPVSTIDIFNSILDHTLGRKVDEKDSKSVLLSDEKREFIFAEKQQDDPDKIREIRDKDPRGRKWFARGLKAAIKADKKCVKDHNGNVETFDVSQLDEVEIDIASQSFLDTIDANLGSFLPEENQSHDEEIKSQLAKLGYNT